MIMLGVNIDHVATLRQARRGRAPDPVSAAALCELAGCDSIVCHLREDRRHIQDRDLRILRETVGTRLNLEMALSEEIVSIALQVRPDQVTLVPERREELTTEGGLDVRTHRERIVRTAERFRAAGIRVSLFIDPDFAQIDASRDTGAEFIEIHTGRYAQARDEEASRNELVEIRRATDYACSTGLRVNAGHGLDYVNVGPVCRIPRIEELNIGYSIVGRAVFVGLTRAVQDMIAAIRANETEDT